MIDAIDFGNQVVYDLRPSAPTIPADGVFARVKFDYEIYGYSRSTRNNALRKSKSLPMTQPYNGVSLTNLDPELQDWINKLSTEAAGGLSPEEQKRSFEGLFQSDTAFTNHQPNLTFGAGQTIKLFPLLTGGAVIKLTGPEHKGQFPFEVIDTSRPYKQFHPSTHPWLFFNPTSSHRVEVMKNGKWTGKYYEDGVSAFWMYKECTVLPVHGGDDDQALIPASVIEILPTGSNWPNLKIQATKLKR